MKKKHYLKDLFFTPRFFLFWGILVVLLIASFFIHSLQTIVQAYFWLLLLVTLLDFGLLFFTKAAVQCTRQLEPRLSNGDQNTIQIQIKSTYKIPIRVELIDELPAQFQQRNFLEIFQFKPNSERLHTYTLTPTERGEYHFGQIHAYASSVLNFVQRRCTSLQENTTKVYPSFLQLRRHHIQGVPNGTATSGSTKLTRRGTSNEFDHIKEYNRGDDVRTVNWKASARRNALMVNSFMDEKSKQVYCIIDKGRLMKMPFNGLTLLDYAINASLMFSFTALHKDDKVGMLTFAEKADDFLQASKSKKQFNAINELLYNQQTKFLESNYADVYHVMNKRAGQRSLLMLFTNFETYVGFERQLPYLRMLNQKHLLCVVIFENTELRQIHEHRGDNLEDIYIRTIASKFQFEKKRIVKEMLQQGILVIYTAPEQLTIQVVNRYLDIKRRQQI